MPAYIPCALCKYIKVYQKQILFAENNKLTMLLVYIYTVSRVDTLIFHACISVHTCIWIYVKSQPKHYIIISTICEHGVRASLTLLVRHVGFTIVKMKIKVKK